MVGLPDSKKNLDHSHPLYGTKNGIYQSGCGISNLMMSWGKDEQLDSTVRHN
jgi:inositol oxygenase